MFLLFSRPFFKTGLGCAAACVLFTGVASAVNTPPQTFTLSDPLLTLGGAGTFALPNFNAGLGTLTDVTLTLKLGGKTFTIFDTNKASSDWVNLTFKEPGSTEINADTLGAWGGSPGNLDVTYQKPADKSVASMGVAGLLLYCTPRNGAAQYMSVNYTYTISSNTATPEPAVRYLSALAAGAMTLLLIGRGLRLSAAKKTAAAHGELRALAVT